MPEKTDEKTKQARVYTCEYCGEEYQSRQGLAKHLPKCEYRPDADNTEDTPPATTDSHDVGGVPLFDDTDDAGNTDDDETKYQCPDCGHVANRPYDMCPECGAELEW